MDKKQQAIINEIIKIVLREGPDYPYHNKDHILRVYEASQLYASRAKISPKETFLLGIAALFHDIIFKEEDANNETYSAQYASKYMKSKGFAATDIKVVEGLILATHVPTHPRTELERLMCDADLDYLGTDNFFLLGDRLRKEWGITDDKKWWDIQEKFLGEHKYYSDATQKLRDKKKAENLGKVKEILKKLKK